jgi:hypothetical protein
MNHLTISPVRIWPQCSRPLHGPLTHIAVTTDIFVDDRQMPGAVNLGAWFPALMQTRLAPIFTCTCGVFYCDGYHVAIEKTPNCWIWRNYYTPFPEQWLKQGHSELGIPPYGEPLPWEQILRDIDTWRWRNGHHFLIETFAYRFAWTEIHAITKRMIEEIRVLAAPYPHAEISGLDGSLTALIR